MENSFYVLTANLMTAEAAWARPQSRRIRDKARCFLAKLMRGLCLS